MINKYNPIADIKKNKTEVLRVNRQQYKGADLLDIRVWATVAGGDLIPTKKGVTLSIDLVGDLSNVLTQTMKDVETERTTLKMDSRG